MNIWILKIDLCRYTTMYQIPTEANQCVCAWQCFCVSAVVTNKPPLRMWVGLSVSVRHCTRTHSLMPVTFSQETRQPCMTQYLDNLPPENPGLVFLKYVSVCSSVLKARPLKVHKKLRHLSVRLSHKALSSINPVFLLHWIHRVKFPLSSSLPCCCPVLYTRLHNVWVTATAILWYSNRGDKQTCSMTDIVTCHSWAQGCWRTMMAQFNWGTAMGHTVEPECSILGSIRFY